MVFPQVLCGFYVFGVTGSCEILLQNFFICRVFWYFEHHKGKCQLLPLYSTEVRHLYGQQLKNWATHTKSTHKNKKNYSYVANSSTLNDYLHNHRVYLIHFFLEKKIWMRLKKGRRVEVCVLCYQPQ